MLNTSLFVETPGQHADISPLPDGRLGTYSLSPYADRWSVQKIQKKIIAILSRSRGVWGTGTQMEGRALFGNFRARGWNDGAQNGLVEGSKGIENIGYLHMHPLTD
jgi:hypothetical protein